MKKVDWKFDDLIPVGSYGKIPYWLVVKADAIEAQKILLKK